MGKSTSKITSAIKKEIAELVDSWIKKYFSTDDFAEIKEILAKIVSEQIALAEARRKTEENLKL
ncbi:MAG: hypothetical protein NZ923_05830 [Candidatus Kryptonium sp.]|nr:hypothetical protein [Candidatus Kryptonium sp.]